MKKFILPILLFLMFIPVIANAKEYCTVVSGNGKDIGSEIACGTEHFYVIDNKDNNIKMLAKYNLYVGFNFEKTVLDINKTYIKYECSYENCTSYSSEYNNKTYYYEGEQVTYQEWKNMIYEELNITELNPLYDGPRFSQDKKALYTTIKGDRYTEDGKNYINETYKIYPYTSILESDTGYALQNALALGVTGNKGDANYPIIASLYLFSGYGSEYTKTDSYDNFENGYLDFKFTDESYIKGYLDKYETNLGRMGFEISSVDLISIKDIDNLVNDIGKKSLPLSSWYNESLNTYEIDNDSYYSEYKLGDLKEYLSNDYKWLWNTTYWTRTFVGNEKTGNYDQYGNLENPEQQVYFISSTGEICYSLSECGGIPRAGIRPVITISSNNLKYLIRTKTDGNGTIEVIDSASGGDSIQFRVSAKKGLKLSGLTITTDSGEKIEFSEEDITADSSGVLSVSTNKFTMPYENVTIEARWASSIINPNTGTGISIIIVMTVLLVSSIIYMMLKRKKNYIIK